MTGSGRGNRALTLLATVLISILAATIALAVVFSTVLATRVEASRTDFGRATSLAAQVQSEFERQLAADPVFYTKMLFGYERPRKCLNMDVGTSTWVLPPGDPNSDTLPAWPVACGVQWEYPQVGQPLSGWNPGAVAARAEVTPLSTGSAVKLRILAAVGDTETGMDVVYSRTSAANWTVYSGTDLNVEQLLHPSSVTNGAPAVNTGAGTSMYADGIMRLPSAGVTFTRARLAAENGFVGSVDSDGTRLLTGQETSGGAYGAQTGAAGVGPLRTTVSTPLQMASLRSSAVELDQLGCPTTDPPSNLVADDVVSYLCLKPGRVVETESGMPVTVPQNAHSWLIVPDGVDPTTSQLNVYWAPSLPTGTATCAFYDCSTTAQDVAAAANGNHVQSSLQTVGKPWTLLGTVKYPSTGVIATGGDTVVGRCPGFANSTCGTDAGEPAGGWSFTRPVTVWAGSAGAAADIWVAGPIRTTGDIPVGLVASGRVVFPTFASPSGVPLEVKAQVAALGTGTSASAAVTGWPTGAVRDILKVNLQGSLAASSYHRIPGLVSMNVSPLMVGQNVEAAPAFPGFTRNFIATATTRLSSEQVCPGRNVDTSASGQALTCVGVW